MAVLGMNILFVMAGLVPAIHAFTALPMNDASC
jgi:hypothetical protein